MRHFTFSLIGGIVVCLCFAGCQTSTPPASTASMAGTVLLIDTMGQRLPSMDGTTVSIEGTTLSTVTDSFGRWSMTNIPTGLHSVRYAHAGFGGERFENVKFLDTGMQHWSPAYLSSPVQQQGYVDSIAPEVSVNGTPRFRVVGRALHSAFEGTLVLLISPDSTFDQSKPQCYTEAQWDMGWYSAPVFHVPYGLIKQQGVSSGTKLYFQIRLAGASDQINIEKYSVIYPSSVSLDPSATHYIFTACGPAGNAMTAVLP